MNDNLAKCPYCGNLSQLESSTTGSDYYKCLNCDELWEVHGELPKELKVCISLEDWNNTTIDKTFRIDQSTTGINL